jgi:hypothetical protein
MVTRRRFDQTLPFFQLSGKIGERRVGKRPPLRGQYLLLLPKIVSDFADDFSRVFIVNIIYLGYVSSDEHARCFELLVGEAGDCCESRCLQREPSSHIAISNLLPAISHNMEATFCNNPWTGNKYQGCLLKQPTEEFWHPSVARCLNVQGFHQVITKASD